MDFLMNSPMAERAQIAEYLTDEEKITLDMFIEGSYAYYSPQMKEIKEKLKLIYKEKLVLMPSRFKDPAKGPDEWLMKRLESLYVEHGENTNGTGPNKLHS